jgi:SAM-dependent methyltransferase
LRTAAPNDRQRLYASVYDELFQFTPDHPQLTRKRLPEEQAAGVVTRLKLLERFLTPDTVFMEVGSGDCSLAARIADRTKRVYAVDVSAEITKGLQLPSNLELIICNATDIPVRPGQVDVAFSYQLIEHLHPADAREHLISVVQALKPSGIYVCVTPNRLSGPHDISKYFETEARGFHMKEYTTNELTALMRGVGFSSVRAVVSARGRFAHLPTGPIAALERLLGPFPAQWRTRIAEGPMFRQLLGVMLVARK